MSSLLDQDIAHIRRVMPLSLSGDLAGPILPASYWRKRLHRLLDTGHVNKGQLADIDSLLIQIDLHELSAASSSSAVCAKRAIIGNAADRG